MTSAVQSLVARLSYFVTEWVLSTNHRRIAVLYFFFVLLSGFTGLVLATIIRLELAYPGQFFLTNNSERYLTTISLHGVVMVFFMIIPVLFGAFGNFLLPTQLGIRDVAFPRLNSFMFWVTPSGFVLLLHIILFDRSYNLTYWLNYGEVKAALRRRYASPVASEGTLFPHLETSLGWKTQLGSHHGLHHATVGAAPAGAVEALAPSSGTPLHPTLIAHGLPCQAQLSLRSCYLFEQEGAAVSQSLSSPVSVEIGPLVTHAARIRDLSLFSQLTSPTLQPEVLTKYLWSGLTRSASPRAGLSSLGSAPSAAPSLGAVEAGSGPLTQTGDLAAD